ncbi:hypothetical protein [Rhodovulum sp. 12E13]|uniref:hypothetical protein n=1 Tax=Rhodovulum sp. 12E13 TaxID=2203891 RepID=UPI0013142CDA|nr:hypothetical protein [Rhodovulum sp. 12E13]
MAKNVLIAETDETGGVAWVWRYAAHDRQPRPVAPGRPCGIDPHAADIHGAERGAVVAWLRARDCLPLSVSDALETVQSRSGLGVGGGTIC